MTVAADPTVFANNFSLPLHGTHNESNDLIDKHHIHYLLVKHSGKYMNQEK